MALDYTNISYLWIFAGFVFMYCCASGLKRRRQLPLPPGPKPLPLLGNAFDLPLAHEYLQYAKWGKEYGDVCHLKALGKHIIILNSVKACWELLDHRNVIYSDRPSLPMMDEPDLMDTGWAFPGMRYSKRWKRHRRLFTQHINPMTISQIFSKKQSDGVNYLLRLILADPKPLKKYLSFVSANVLLDIAYGYGVQSLNDPLVKLAETTPVTVSEGFQPKFLVNVFPILKYIPAWFPGAGFKRFAHAARAASKKLMDEPFDEAVEKIAQGKASSSFIQYILEEKSEGNDPTVRQDIKEVAATMYAAGSDTTLAAVYYLILELILNPEIQARVQKELDGVLGSPNSDDFHLPTWNDRPSTPYLAAVIKEVLRHHPPAGSGVPHSVTEEDEYRGWRIPKGSIVFANAYGMLHSEEHYKDPYVFHPERFLGDKPELDPTENGTFGFGRRICPGQMLAENMLWLESASLFAAFNFSLARNEDGSDIDIKFALTPKLGFIQHPPTYPCTIIPRSKNVERIIQDLDTNEE